MPLDRCLDPLWLNTNVTLSDSSGTVLKQTLDKGNVVPIVFVDLGSIPLPETVGADVLIAEIVTDDGKLLLYGSGCDGEDQVILSDVVSQTVILDVLGDDHGDGEDALLASLLLGDL